MPLAALLLFPMQFLKNKLSIFAHLSGPEEEVRVEEGGGEGRLDEYAFRHFAKKQ